MARTESEIAALREVIVGRLDLATVVIAAEYVLPSALGDFRIRYPEVALNLQIFNSQEVEEAVADGRFELGITLSHSLPENLNVEHICNDELVVVVSTRHRLSGKSAVNPHVLASEIFLVREPTSGTRLFIERKFADLGLRLTYGMELRDNQVIKAMVEANLGIAILSSRGVEQEVASGRLHSLRVEGIVFERPLSLVSRKEAVLSLAARAFRSVLLNSALRPSIDVS
jgi:DNA-binding transcriptional LysR family regulator